MPTVKLNILSMHTYSLARALGASEKQPFDSGQIRKMHGSGTKTVVSQLCPHETDELVSVVDELDAGQVAGTNVAAPPALSASAKQSSYIWFSANIGTAGLLILGVSSWQLGLILVSCAGAMVKSATEWSRQTSGVGPLVTP